MTVLICLCEGGLEWTPSGHRQLKYPPVSLSAASGGFSAGSGVHDGKALHIDRDTATALKHGGVGLGWARRTRRCIGVGGRYQLPTDILGGTNCHIRGSSASHLAHWLSPYL